jgi:hypothetical protein
MSAAEEAAPDAGSGPTARMARRLALAGFLPILVLSLWLFGIAEDHPWRAVTLALLKSYGAVILSFLGGIRWGLGMVQGGQGSGRALAASCLPPLAGWAAVFVTEPYSFALLAVAFAAQGAWDVFAAHAGVAPRWFGATRTLLTVLVVAAMVLSFVATA